MKFSCIMGTYNPKKEWLFRAIESAAGLFDEVLIVDDGSKNMDIGEEVQKFCKEKGWLGHYLIKTVGFSDNKGFVAAKNKGIEQCTGDVICILDDDDYFDRDGVVAMKKFVEENDSDIWHFILREFNEGSGLFLENTTPDGLPWNNTIAGVSWFKRKMWEDVGGFEKCVAEDWAYWQKCLYLGKKFTYAPIVVYNMNRRHDSTSMSWTGQKFEDNRKEVRELNRKYLTKEEDIKHFGY